MEINGCNTLNDAMLAVQARECVNTGRLLRGRPSCYHNNAPPGNSDAADLINAYQFLHQDMEEAHARIAQALPVVIR